MLLVLVCFVVLSSLIECGRNDRVYLMEVRLPTLEHRDEEAEILHIKRFLTDTIGVDDKYVFKVLGEPRAYAVVKISGLCRWSILTTNFVYMGEDFFVTNLYEGEHYAEDLGLNNTLGNPPTRFDDTNLYFIDVTFKSGPGEMMATYQETMRNVTSTLFALRQDAVDIAVYKVLGQSPTRLLIFANLSPPTADSLSTDLYCPERCTMKATMLQNLDTYVRSC